jgi:hypothetical protein
MPDQLKLEILKSHSAGQMVCPICGETFQLLSTAALLSAKTVPLGYLCEKCLLSGPKGAAARVRARADELRTLLAKADKNLPANEWASMHKSIWERVDNWELLAAQLKRMKWEPEN